MPAPDITDPGIQITLIQNVPALSGSGLVVLGILLVLAAGWGLRRAR